MAMGSHGNAWNAAVVAANGVSPVIDVADQTFITAFGSVSAAATITLQGSMDGVNFYAIGSAAPGAAGDFSIHVTTGVRFVRLKSSAAVTITASIAGK